jgi:hypothetical protein
LEDRPVKLLIAASLLAVAAAPALAAQNPPAPAKSRRDPNEVICKLQSTTAGIPQRVCVTRAEWEKASSRTRQELMVTQRTFCGGGASC